MTDTDTPTTLPATAGYDDAALARLAADVPAEWVAAMRLAGRIHNTVFVPKPLRGDPSSVLACILAGGELGLKPLQALRMVHVIEGRPSASAELMRALVHRAGHRLSVVEYSNERVSLHGVRRDTGAQGRATFTMADAQRAKLLTNPAWAKYPASMLLARATSSLCRQLFSDVVSGLYTPEESAAIEGHVYDPGDYGGELVDPLDDDDLELLVGEPDPDPDDEADEAWRREARDDEAAP